MVIVAGYLIITKNKRTEFLEKSKNALIAARKNKECLAFDVSPDLIDENRVCIFEKWENLESLKKFREDGPSDDLSSLIQSAQVYEYQAKVI